MTEFTMMMIALVALFIALIIVIVLLNERKMDERFPMTRKREKARMMSEEYRR